MFNKVNIIQKNKSGQAAIILILATAIALIFYAVTLNIGGVSQAKTVVTIASNMGASQLASQMASYGENLFQTQLGGSETKCSGTGLLTAIIVLVIVVVSCIYGGCAAAGAATGLFGGALIVATVVIGLAVASVYIQATKIQPGIDAMWNEIQARTMTRQDSFVETGIRAGLVQATSDGVLTPDLTDADGDGVWGFETVNSVVVPKDEISRFAHYYSKRMSQIQAPSTAEVISFQEALRDFMVVNTPSDTDGWGLHDPVDCNLPLGNPCCGDINLRPSECNPCCQPVSIDVGGVTYPARDITVCPPGFNYEDICSLNSAFSLNIPFDPSDYPWVYDPYFENFNNDVGGTGVLSFRELMGQDDKHQKFTVNEMARLWRSAPAGNKQLLMGPAPDVNNTLKERFLLQDSMSFYSEPVYDSIVVPVDDHIGIFPVFYKLADWGVGLNNVTPTDLTFSDPFNPECHWCDPVDPACEVCDPLTHPVEIPQLLLPLDPLTLTFNITYQVDGLLSNVPGNPPLASDSIVLPDGVTSFWGVTPREILADDIECADEGITFPTVGIWKRGDDRFCRDVFPYDVECPKFLGGVCDDNGDGVNDLNCSCEEQTTTPINRAKYPDDILDSLLNDIVFFFKDLEGFAFANPLDAANSFFQWYTVASEWIEPGPDEIAADPSLACFTCAGESGGLWLFGDALREVSLRFSEWISSVSFAGASCEDVWCVPSSGTGDCNAPAAEVLTFDANGNGIRGDMGDVVACLDYNVNGPTGLGGNDVRFQACGATCNATNCSALPRSLIPFAQFDPNAYASAPTVSLGIQSDIDLMLTCLDSCSNANCRAMPQYQNGGGCNDYFSQPPATFNEVIDCLDVSQVYFPLSDPKAFDETVDCTGVQYFSLDPLTYNFEDPTGVPALQTKACYYFGQPYFPSLGDPLLRDFEGLGDCLTWAPGNAWYDAMTSVLGTGDWSPAPGDEQRFNDCLGTCSNINCQAVPYYPDMEQTSTWWNEYNINLAAITASVDNAAISSCVDNCNNFNCQSMPQGMTWGPGVFWYDELSAVGQGWQLASSLGAFEDNTRIVQCALMCSDLYCRPMTKYQSFWHPGNIWYDEITTALTWSIPAADRIALQSCLDSCTNQDLPSGTIDSICQAMPLNDASTCGVQYFPVDPGAGTNFDETIDCDASGVPNNVRGWYNDIVRALRIANPVCDMSDGDNNPQTTLDNGWLLNTRRSALEAQNQVAKFRKRHAYLNGRLLEMQKIVSITDTAAQKTDEFLRGPSQALIQYRIDYTSSVDESGLPKTAVYVWQDEKSRPGDPLNYGYWHIVRVDARTPGRCNNACGVGGSADPPWPSVRTFKKSWGLKRCYTLDNRSGVVKYRVTRFDESKRSSKMKFANGANIWNFKNYHPDVGEVNPSAMILACASEMDADPPGLPPGIVDIYKNAFILNERTTANEACWNAVHITLQAGVMTETCAQYDFDGTGFTHTFVECQNFF